MIRPSLIFHTYEDLPHFPSTRTKMYFFFSPNVRRFISLISHMYEELRIFSPNVRRFTSHFPHTYEDLPFSPKCTKVYFSLPTHVQRFTYFLLHVPIFTSFSCHTYEDLPLFPPHIRRVTSFSPHIYGYLPFSPTHLMICQFPPHIQREISFSHPTHLKFCLSSFIIFRGYFTKHFIKKI